MIKMKSTILSCMIGVSLIMASCSSGEDTPIENGTGSIQLSVNTNTTFGTTTTRAVNESAYANTDDYTVQILQNDDEIESFRYGDRSSTYKLDNGNYTLKAYYGTESNASRNSFYVVGSTNFVVNGNTQPISVDCYPTCGKMIVDFDSKMANYFSDYYVTFETETLAASDGAVTWAKADTDPWYLKLNDAGETVTATIHYIINGATESKSTTLTYPDNDNPVKMTPGKSWTLHIAPKDGNGALSITITIDESTNDKEYDVVVPSDWV